MLKPRLQSLLRLALAVSLLSAPLAGPTAAAWGLNDATQAFSSTNAVGNHVCLVHDNWQIALLSHNKDEIGAVFIIETKEDAAHNLRLNAIAGKLAELIEMTSPVIQEMDGDKKAGIMIDADIMERLADDAENVFHNSPLEGMAYLLQDGYFYINAIRPNGYLHWKTVKKSGVELLMPMAPLKLTALEVTGRQTMDEYATEFLARKLGLGSNTANATRREALRQQINTTELPYMNTKSNIIGSYHQRRFVIGKRTSVVHMLSNRYGGTLLFPSQSCDWPTDKNETTEEVVETVKEVKPLTPREARDKYLEFLRNLGS